MIEVTGVDVTVTNDLVSYRTSYRTGFTDYADYYLRDAMRFYEVITQYGWYNSVLNYILINIYIKNITC